MHCFNYCNLMRIIFRKIAKTLVFYMHIYAFAFVPEDILNYRNGCCTYVYDIHWKINKLLSIQNISKTLPKRKSKCKLPKKF